MRRLMFLLVAASFLGTMVGCNTCGSRGCGLGSGCSTGGCASGACGGGNRSHAHGICDCEFDEYCSSRSPWIRYGGQSAPMSVPMSVPITEVIPATPAKVLPKSDMKL